MTNPRSGLGAIILAGGRSTRFGSDKASALLGGRPLLEWVVRATSGVCGEVTVVRAKGQQLPGIEPSLRFGVIEDVQDGLGPLAGIIAGLRASKSGHCLVCSCDAPLLQPALVEFLDRQCEASAADVVLPIVNGHPQPLLAVYRREAVLPVFESALATGDLKINRIIADLALHRIEESQILPFDSSLDSFRNCNTPGALAELESRLQGGSAARP